MAEADFFLEKVRERSLELFECNFYFSIGGLSTTRPKTYSELAGPSTTSMKNCSVMPRHVLEFAIDKSGRLGDIAEHPHGYDFQDRRTHEEHSMRSVRYFWASFGRPS